MTLNRLQRAALIVGLVAIGAETLGWLASTHGVASPVLTNRVWFYPHPSSFPLFTITSWWLVAEWVATAAFTIAAMVLLGTRWYVRKKKRG